MAPADSPGVLQYDEGRADFPVDKELGLDQGDLSRFLLTHSMHLVTEFTPQVSWAGGAGGGRGRGQVPLRSAPRAPPAPVDIP